VPGSGKKLAFAQEVPRWKTRPSQTFSYSSSGISHTGSLRWSRSNAGKCTPILVSRFLELRAGKTGLPRDFLCRGGPPNRTLMGGRKLRFRVNGLTNNIEERLEELRSRSLFYQP